MDAREVEDLVRLNIQHRRRWLLSLSTQDYVERVQSFGWPLADRHKLYRLENDDRRMKLHEFLAIAAALYVSPAEMSTYDFKARRTSRRLRLGRRTFEGERVRQWFTGERNLPGGDDDELATSWFTGRRPGHGRASWFRQIAVDELQASISALILEYRQGNAGHVRARGEAAKRAVDRAVVVFIAEMQRAAHDR